MVLKSSEQSNRWIILLRGINVAGKGILKMKDLQAALVKNGFQNVQTYIQSGNLILDTKKSEEALKSFIMQMLKDEFSLQPAVFLISMHTLIHALEQSPFDEALEQNKVFMLFSNEAIKQTQIEPLSSYAKDGEEMKVQEGQLYIYYPNGMGKSKLTSSLIERKLNLLMTARNLNTVRKLVELVMVEE